MVMLLQLYAPEDEPAAAFHRMLYVFICRNGRCHKTTAGGYMRVFRFQLSENNGIYGRKDVESTAKSTSPSSDSNGCTDEEYESEDDIEFAANVMPDIIVRATISLPIGNMGIGSNAALMDIDVENNGNTGDSDDDFDDDPHDIDGIAHNDKALVPVNNERADDSAVDVDSEFLAFQSRIARNTDQVIRYARSPFSNKTGEPLYVSSMEKPKIDVDVPRCGHCGATREFEFQIMPQLLNYLSIDSTDPSSIDWGTLLVYTCPRNCSVYSDTSSKGPQKKSDESIRSSYLPEVICRQNFSTQGIGEKYVRAMHGDDSGFQRQFQSLDI
ncbi:hypothetical protein H4217_004894 [Coemansia sp. RSA 1939]|nr:hypothetical protein H4217_004894 [Coemansia sp. RSA 1939]